MFKVLDDNSIQCIQQYDDIPEGAFIPKEHRWYRVFEEWVKQGNVPQTKTLDEMKQEKISEIYRIYEEKQKEGVVCITTTGKTFVMDSYMGAPQTLRDGIQFSELASIYVLTITDMYNVDHPNVTIEESREILLQQSQKVFNLRETKNNLRSQVVNAQSEEEINVITWSE